jgi:hypothetical protein
MSENIKRLLLSFAFLLSPLFVREAQAKTINAAFRSQTEGQRAINSASADNQCGLSFPSVVDECEGTSHYRHPSTSTISTAPLKWASIVPGTQPSATGAAPNQPGVIS